MALADYINNKPVIETERLVIRPMSVLDVPSLKKWMPDKSIYTYWGKGPSKAEMNPELLFEKPERPTKSFHLGIAEKESNEVIGDLWVYLIENDRMAQVDVRNTDSAKMLEKCGYSKEGLIRQGKMVNTWCDYYVYGILASDIQ